jgi:RNA polymerase sigma-70 factor (ECF subfamily)
MRESQAIANKQVTGSTLETLLRGKQKFLAFVEKRVGSRALAEDILQDAFVRSIERAGELDRELATNERATAWFFRVLRNAVIDHYRHQAVEQRANHQWGQDWERAAELSDEEAHEVCGCFKEFLGLLKPDYRRAIEAVELGSVSLREFGEAEGISLNNAAVRVHRARTALRRHIEQACSTCAEHGCLDCDCKKLSDCK